MPVKSNSRTFICQAPETWLKYTTALLHLSAKALKVLLSFFAENLKNGPYFSRFNKDNFPEGFTVESRSNIIQEKGIAGF